MKNLYPHVFSFDVESHAHDVNEGLSQSQKDTVCKYVTGDDSNNSGSEDSEKSYGD